MLHVPNKSIQFHYWNTDYLNLVEFQSMYWEMETVFFSALSRQLNNTPFIYALLEFNIFCITLYIQTLLYLLSDFRVAYVANISGHITIAWEIDHHTGNYVPYSFSTSA